MGSVVLAIEPEGTDNLTGSTEASKAAFRLMVQLFAPELQKSKVLKFSDVNGQGGDACLFNTVCLYNA